MFEEEIVIPKCFYPEFMFLSIRKRNTSWIPAIALNDKRVAGMTKECITVNTISLFPGL